MPYFLCRLANARGRIVSQSILAPSRDECRKYFEQEGYCILSIKRDWKKLQVSIHPFEKKIKDKDFIMFNQELVALIKAGYPILKCIEIIVSRIKNIHIKELLMRVGNEVRAGKSLSESFSIYNEGISTVYIASLMAGERSGNLAATIRRFITYQKVIVQTKSRIKTALTYPTLLLLFSLILMAILINFVIPRFSSFYQDFDAKLPGITVALVAFSLAVRKYFLVVIALSVVFVVVFMQMRKKEKVQIFLNRLKLKIPYGNRIWIESAVSLFCRTLGLLLEGGISLISALGIARESVPNKFLKMRMHNLPEHIKNGESLSDSIAYAQYFPPLALDMIKIGESSANLEGMLADVAEVYDDRIKARIDTFVTLVEPIIIVFMGLMIAMMLLSVYLPIFNIIKVTH